MLKGEFNEEKVLFWNAGNVLELDGDGGCIT